MKKNQLFIVIFHDDNGLSFLRGVFTTWFQLCNFIDKEHGKHWIPTTVGRKLEEQQYATLITSTGQYTITCTEPDQEVNLNIN